MLRLRIIHYLRTTAFLLVVAVVLGAIGTLLWANFTGMPKSWRQAVERGIAKHGIHVEIGSLSYNPLEGIVARQVKVFANADRQQVISRLEGIILDLDNAKLAKGEIQLAKVKLHKARLVLPVDPQDPDSEVLEIDNIQGEFIPPGNPHIEVRNARGTIAGIEIVLNAKITDDLPSIPEVSESPAQEGQRELIAKIIKELKQWSFDEQTPPQIRIQCVGKRSEIHQAKASISFRANSIEKNQHIIDQLHADAELHGNSISVHSINARNGSKHLNARLDYELDRQHGRFHLRSSIEIPELLQSWLGMKPLNDLLIAGDQNLNASGEFHVKAGEPLDIHATGYGSCESAMLRGIRFEQIKSDFAWRNGDLFLKDLHLIRPDGQVTGKVLVQGDLVRIDMHSTLLPEFYRPLFLGKPTEQIIDRFVTKPESRMELRLEGGFDKRDPSSWAYAGKLSLRDINHRGVDLESVDTDLSVSSVMADFTNGTVTFDYSNYAMAKRFAGPDQGKLSYKSVRYRRDNNRQVSFTGLEGTFWPAPACRLFLNKTSDHLEKYGFHHPPKINGSGHVDLQNAKTTHLEFIFSSDHQAQYVLLNAPVTLGKPSGKVTVTDKGVTIDDLKLTAFEGPVVAKLDFPKQQPMAIDLEVTSLSMNEINSCYGFNIQCGGYLTGKMKFNMMPGAISTMQGTGNLQLQKSELFSVPIFGPLTHLLQSVLADKRVGAERAKDASCTFLIQDGVLATNDFRTTTNSLVFAGEGWVDLDKKLMDMTMRMNGRGLLGILNIPLKPFYGLFQFRGTGPLKTPVWEKVAFTKPNDKVQEMLLKTPAQKAGQP